jgi:hypothetical protein
MTHKHKRKEGELEFQLLLAATLPLFLIATMAHRLLPWNWGADSRSVFKAARAAAYNSIPFAFS